MDFSAKLSLPYLLPNQAQKHVTQNESLRALDAIVQLSVISVEQTSPPDAPSEGDRYVVAGPASADWAGADGQIAAYQDGAWAFYTPQTGWTAWAEESALLMVFDGEDWIELSASGDASSPETLGINASADAVNRLSVRSEASLFSHEGAGHQIKINKASETDTASVLFQSNWCGRAEIGLTGSDDFLLKTSPDGETFAPTLLARPGDGYVGIGTWSPTTKLHVAGPIRVGTGMVGELPDPQTVGRGTLMFVDYAGHSIELVYSDGSNWRSVRTERLSG
jgi:uncharacterized protein DUF2793